MLGNTSGKRVGASPSGRAMRALTPAVAGIAVCGLIAGCGSSTNTSSKSAAGAKVPLVIYAAEGYDVAEGKAFQAATGIPTKVDDNSTGPLTTKIEAEKNNPQWDLFWVDGDEVFASLDSQGLLLKGFTPTVSYDALAKKIAPSDKSYYPTGVTAAAALVYDTKTVKNPPTSWSQLLSSKYKGAVGMNDPAVSGPTYPYIAGMSQSLGGVSQGEAFYKKLKANGLHVYQTNTNTLQALETGTIKLATIQSSAGTGAGFSNHDIKVAYLKPETVLPSVLGIDAHVSKTAQAEARRFVNFVYSAKGQKVMQSGDPTGDSLFWPAVTGEQPLKPLPALSTVPTQVLNASQWGAREASINTWFTDNIVQ